MKINIPYWKIAVLIASRLPETIKEVALAHHPTSDGGKKITKDEWRYIAIRSLMGLGEELTELLVSANS